MDYATRKQIGAEVKETLEREFMTSLSERELAIGGDINHRFDLVSEDGKIVVEIKAFEPRGERERSNLAPSQIDSLVKELFLLSQVRGANRRVLIIVDKYAFANFVRSEYARLADENGIKVRHVETIWETEKALQRLARSSRFSRELVESARTSLLPTQPGFNELMRQVGEKITGPISEAFAYNLLTSIGNVDPEVAHVAAKRMGAETIGALLDLQHLQNPEMFRTSLFQVTEKGRRSLSNLLHGVSG